MTSCSTPSMRNRMRRSCSVGSTWMSDARSSTAWVIEQVDELDDRRVLDDLADAGEVVVVVGARRSAACTTVVDVGVEAVEAVDRRR